MLPRVSVRCGVAALALAGALTACSGGSSSQSDRDRPMRLVWSDEFNGAAGSAPDAASWTTEQFGGAKAGNNELECYTDRPDNVSLDGQGHLVLTALRSNADDTCADGSTNQFTSGRVSTEGKRSWTYGRLEVRALVPGGGGTWPAFWAMGADKSTVGWPACGEIDVMEHVGHKPTTVSGTIHGPTTDGAHWYRHTDTTADQPLNENFHVYAVDWDADGMTWSLDGHAFSHVSRAEAEKQGEWVFDKPFFLLLNLAVGGDLGGTVPDTTPFPQHYLVDYVRVYQEQATDGAG